MWALHQLDRPNGHIAYNIIHGRGDGTVVMVHGLVSNSMSWTTVARELSNIYTGTIISIDLRGRGMSTLSNDAEYRSFDDHVDDIIAVLDSNNVQRCVLVGHSMGTWLCEYILSKRPERVAGVVLIDGGFGNDSPNDDMDRLFTDKAIRFAISRIGKQFKSQQEYFDFMMPPGCTIDQVDADKRTKWIYELDDSFTPRLSKQLIEKDVDWLLNRSLTNSELHSASQHCEHIVMIAAEHGLTPTSPPIICGETYDEMVDILDPEIDVRIEGTDHNTILMGSHASSVARLIDVICTHVKN